MAGRMKERRLSLLLVFALGPFSWAQGVVYVNGGATGGNDGTSWQDAFTDLRAGLAASTAGDEIWVAMGTYMPGPLPSDTFHLKSGVAIYGGFQGVESYRSERDPLANVTTLDGRGVCAHVLTGVGVSGGILDGLTVTGGHVPGPGGNGGGIYFAGGLTVQSCIFRNNSATNGSAGGATSFGGRFFDCLFEDNDADDSGGAVFGVEALTRCTFRDNFAVSGGAVGNPFAPAAITDCWFEHNIDSFFGGGAVQLEWGGTVIGSTFIGTGGGGEGGGVLAVGKPVLFVGCTFARNSGDIGGGAASVSSNSTFVSCTFVENSVALGSNNDDMVVIACSFSNNLGAAVACTSGGSRTITDSILWGDDVEITSNGGSVTVTYSDVQGGHPGAGNVDVDPLFFAATGGDLRLLAGSPCIDAGANAGIPSDSLDLDADGDTTEPTPYDHEGRPRFFDDPATPDTGAGAPPIVDMGAHEYTPFRQEDIVVGEGLGQPNADRVRVFDGAGHATTIDFYANGSGKWGTNVASGNIDGGADAEILTGPGPGPIFGPVVHGWRSNGTSIAKVNFYAYGTLKFGVNVASAPIDPDAFDEILSGAGPGPVFGPHVRAFDFDGQGVQPISKVSYFAYSTLKFGVNVSAGSLDADAFAEILTGPGPGIPFAPLVRGWNYDGATVTSIGKVNYYPFTTLQYGVNLVGGDADGDAFAEILATPGPGPTASFPSLFLGHDYDGASVAVLPGFDVTPFPTFYGGRIGSGDMSASKQDALLCGSGRDPSASSEVRSFLYDGSTLGSAVPDFLPFGAAGYGVNVTGADLGL
ncbi:MAG: right-handed parallel beta-helix repeat-containing protein [Acidobacteriota bacterium]